MRKLTFVNDVHRLVSAIAAAINGFKHSGQSFSAHDVTVSIRNMYPDEEIDHNTVRGYVHDMLRHAGVKTTNTNGYIEYEFGTPGAPAAALAPNIGQAHVLTAKSERRVCVPDDLVAKAGFSVGQKVYIHKNGAEITVNDTPSGRSLTVDNHKNIRIRTYFRVDQHLNCEVRKGSIRIFP